MKPRSIFASVPDKFRCVIIYEKDIQNAGAGGGFADDRVL